MRVTTRWYGDEYKRKLYAHLSRNMDRAAMGMVQRVKDSFGNSGVTGTRGGATRSQRASNRSRPWGPPNVDTGHLKRNVGWSKPIGRPFIRRVGTGIGGAKSVGYAMWLEFGTRRMLPRPFLRPRIYKDRATLRRELARPMR